MCGICTSSYGQKHNPIVFGWWCSNFVFLWFVFGNPEPWQAWPTLKLWWVDGEKRISQNIRRSVIEKSLQMQNQFPCAVKPLHAGWRCLILQNDFSAVCIGKLRAVWRHQNVCSGLRHQGGSDAKKFIRFGEDSCQFYFIGHVHGSAGVLDIWWILFVA